MLWTAVAGDIQRSASAGIRYVHGYSSSGSPAATTVQAPRAGLWGIALQQSLSSISHYLPVDNTYDMVAADAGRTYLAAAFEWSYDDMSDAIGEYVVAGRWASNPATVQRELRLRTDGDIRFTPTQPWTTVTTTNTSLQDTRYNFVTQGVQVGDWVSTATMLLKVTSITTTTNPNDTLIGTAGWRAGPNPGNNLAYYVYSAVGLRFEVWDNAATPIQLLSSNVLAYEQRSTVHYIEWKFAPTAVGNPSTELLVDGAPVSGSPSSAGNNTNPGTANWYYYLQGSAGKTNNWHGYSYLYNLLLWDNLGSGHFSGAFASQYAADVTKRPYVSFLAPASGAPQFDAWTKSSGTDASALVGDAATRPNADETTWVDGGGLNTKQAWKHAGIASASLPIGSADTIYAVVAKAEIRPFSTPNAPVIALSVWDGTAETATKTTTADYDGAPGLNPLHGVWEADSGGAPWTPATLGSVQTVVKQVVATNPRVYLAGLWAVGVSGAGAPPPPPPPVPAQVLGGKGPHTRPAYDFQAHHRPGGTGDILRAVRDIAESLERTSRQ